MPNKFYSREIVEVFLPLDAEYGFFLLSASSATADLESPKAEFGLSSQ